MYPAADRYGGAPAVPMPGLGFLQFATFAPVVADQGGNLIGEIFSWGDTPDHDRAQLWRWAQGVASSGAGICAAGKATRDIAPGLHGEGDPGFKTGELIRFSLPEVIAAVNAAPTGRPGDPPSAASYEGLRTAVSQPMLQDGESKRIDVRPLMTSRDATARLAVGVAHGRLDCGVGWQEEPAVVHLRRIVDNYRNRPTSPVAAVADTVTSAASSAVESVKPLAASILPTTDEGKGAALFIGMIAAGLLFARMGGSFKR